MTIITKQVCHRVHEELRTAVEAVLAKHGMKLDRSSARYSDTSIRFAIETKSTDPEAGKREFAEQAGYLGFKPEHYGAEFTAGGERFRFTGVNLRKRKMPCNILRLRDNAPRVCTVGMVARGLVAAKVMTKEQAGHMLLD